MQFARLVSIAALAAATGLGMAACSPRGDSTGTGTGAGGTAGGTGSSGTTAPGSTTTPAMPPASAASQ